MGLDDGVDGFVDSEVFRANTNTAEIPHVYGAIAGARGEHRGVEGVEDSLFNAGAVALEDRDTNLLLDVEYTDRLVAGCSCHLVIIWGE